MQTRTQRELYYSAEHWRKQEYDTQFERIKYLSEDHCNFDSVKEIDASFIDRVNECRFQYLIMNRAADDIVINGINFSMMIEDEKARLHKMIDDKASCIVIAAVISEAMHLVNLAKIKYVINSLKPCNRK